jgi:hypothetical protein
MMVRWKAVASDFAFVEFGDDTSVVDRSRWRRPHRFLLTAIGCARDVPDCPGAM